MNRVVKDRKGFTLIELMLAMAFISLLLRAIAMTVIQIGKTYNRGMMIKELNQTARTINDDIRRTIRASQPIDIAQHYHVTATSGRLCLGQVTYIWNTEKQVDNRTADFIGFANSDDVVRFVKIPDLGGDYCARQSGNFILRYIRESDRATMVDLLKTNDYELAIHGLSIAQNATQAASTTGQQLLSVTIGLGTGDITAMNDMQTSCLPPHMLSADVNNCFVQQFSIVARTGNKVD